MAEPLPPVGKVCCVPFLNVSTLDVLPEPALDDVMENTMFLMIFPFSAVPAPEKSITPTREPLADVFWYAPWHAPLEEPLLQEKLPYSA